MNVPTNPFDVPGKRSWQQGVISPAGPDLVTGDGPLHPDLWVGICGPLVIKRNGIESRALPAGQRTVLGMLALSAGMAVMPDSIIGVLWPDYPPVTAAGIVHTYVSRLRGMFGYSGDRESFITRDGAGYRLRLAADRLDLLAFRQSAARARETADAGQACVLYERAMRLWRGSPLEDVETLRDHPAVAATANERILAALEYAERAATAGRHEMVLAHLVALAVGNPLDERLHAALMVALAGSGRQAESLRVYQDLRRRLDDELGMPPGEELRQAHQRVLRQEIASGKPEDAWRVVRQLPAAPGDFVGRRAEREALIGAASTADGQVGVPVAVVCGQPGVGKTTLALHAAHELSECFPDGQLWLQLAGASERPRDPGEVLGEMLRDLGVPGPAISDEHSERPRALRSALAGRKVLVVADDAASVAQVEPLLPGTPGCALIVTSRMQLAGLTGARYV
ncbi:MAG TPA: BTAD domain-containing putative transcriptional regulator, partial [Trebonia sp.]